MRLTELIFGWQGAVAAVFILTWGAIYLVYLVLIRPGRAPHADSRYDNRFHSSFKGRLTLNGTRRHIRGVDLSNSGALVTSRAPLAAGSAVFLSIDTQNLMGWAKVRHCTRRRMFGYYIGLEFRGPLMRGVEGNWQFSRVTNTSRKAIGLG